MKYENKCNAEVVKVSNRESEIGGRKFTYEFEMEYPDRELVRGNMISITYVNKTLAVLSIKKRLGNSWSHGTVRKNWTINHKNNIDDFKKMLFEYVPNNTLIEYVYKNHELYMKERA